MIGVIGTNHSLAPLEVREAISRAFVAARPSLVPSVFLSTCNRVEWYFSSRIPAKTHQEIIASLRELIGSDLITYLYTFFGADCCTHLGRVVTGLDSLFVGETEIQGQVKTAYIEAQKEGLLSRELHVLFQKALHTGKVIRNQLSSTIPSHETLCEKVVETIKTSLPQDAPVLLVGSSMINREIASKLCCYRVTITNRTDSSAQALAQVTGGTVLPWSELHNFWCRYPCVITATKSPQFLSLSHQEELPQLVIDLGVPRNVNPGLASKSRTIMAIDAFVPTGQNIYCREMEETVRLRSLHDYLNIYRFHLKVG